MTGEPTMAIKDWLTVLGIGATFAVAVANLIHTVLSGKKAAFVNTVTTSRLKWIDSLRDEVSEFIAVTVSLLEPDGVAPNRDTAALVRQRDTLGHQIILHLNPNDPEDKRIRELVEQASDLRSGAAFSGRLPSVLGELRSATQMYLKKEWNRVKQESLKGPTAERS